MVRQISHRQTVIRRTAAMLLLAYVVVPSLDARFLRRGTPHARAGAIALRRRLHINPLITEPGTVEMEWNNAWTWSETYSLPSTLKWTPEGSHVWWGRTEVSANFDVISSGLVDDRRITHSSDHVTVTATTLLRDGARWDFAFAPLATVSTRGDQSSRYGATAISRYDHGRDSLGGTLTWTGTTSPSDSSPAGIWDLGGGYGHVFGNKITAHGDTQYERSTGFTGAWSLFEGIEYQFTDRVAVDISGQHLNVVGGTLDHQVVIGLTVNFGRTSSWFAHSR